MNGMDASGAQLDWFGVAVKAAEIPVWTARMKMLARKVCTYPAVLLLSVQSNSVPLPPFLELLMVSVLGDQHDIW